jgi:hypothetical protein
MGKVIEAVFEGGAFRPLNGTGGVAEHARARVLLCEPAAPGRLRDAKGTLTLAEAQEQIRALDAEFGGIEGTW